MKRRVLGAVLAGGESRRMGRDKALLPVAGEPLIRRVSGVLREVFPEVVVVARSGDAYPFLGLPVLADAIPGQGPLGGLYTALGHAAPDAVFAAACDLPGLTVELVRHLLGEAERLEARSPAPNRPWAVVPAAGGRLHPLCAVYSTACRGPLADSLRGGDLAAVGFLGKIDTLEVPVAELPFYRDDLLANLNRPEDYAGWRTAARRGTRR